MKKEKANNKKKNDESGKIREIGITGKNMLYRLGTVNDTLLFFDCIHRFPIKIGA